MAWYNYRQNNSGGSFVYDPHSGIAVNVWVEAGTPAEANVLASQIGIYFDDSQDCSCCGSRWNEKGQYSWDDSDDNPPEPEETFKVDEFDSSFNTKWFKEGEYETFVHPLGKDFYGAHAVTEVVRKLTYGGENGYGLTVGRDYVTEEPVPVSELGWDEEGNYSVPSPGYRFYRSDANQFYITEDGIRIQHVEAYGYASIWTPTKAQAEQIIEEINDYLDKTPRPDTVKTLLELHPAKEFQPVDDDVFDDGDDV
jgi:hypothetical protein